MIGTDVSALAGELAGSAAVWISSPAVVTANLIHAARVPASALDGRVAVPETRWVTGESALASDARK